MKKLLAATIFSVICAVATAQKYVPVIKAGTVFTYDAFSKNLGQHIPLTLTVNSLSNPLTLQWEVQGYGTGTFEIPATAMESGTKLVIKQPEPDGITKMKDDETLVVISKTTFNSLVKDKAFTLNNQRFTVTTDTAVYKINDKAADIFHALSENGKSEIWVINNPGFPLVYKAKSITRGIDFTLTAVKE